MPRPPEQPRYEYEWPFEPPSEAQVKRWLRGTHYGFNAFMFVGGKKVTTSGTENRLPANEGRVDALTHHNSHDAPAAGEVEWRYSGRALHYVTKNTLLRGPLGFYLSRLGGFPADREEGRFLNDTVRYGADIARAGGVVGSFEEGTRTNGWFVDDILGIARLIARQAGVLIQPVAIVGDQDLSNKRPRAVHLHFWEPMEANGSRKVVEPEIRARMQLAMNAGREEYQSRYGRQPGTGAIIIRKPSKEVKKRSRRW